MAGQSIFCRVFSLLNGSKMILTNRINHVNFTPTSRGLKQDQIDLKKFKIPEKPKKPLTAFFSFMTEKRPVLLKEKPALSSKDVVKELSEQWKSLGSIERGKYEEQAKQNKSIYDQKLLNYTESLTPLQENILKELAEEKSEDRKRKRFKKELKDEQKPKRPTSSFGIFVRACNGEKGRRGEKKIFEFIKELRDQWIKMTDEEKNKYKIEYQKNKEQYDKELEAWEARMIAAGKEQLVRTQTLNRLSSKEKGGNKTSKHE